jgi:hypothetical protein
MPHKSISACQPKSSPLMHPSDYLYAAPSHSDIDKSGETHRHGVCVGHEVLEGEGAAHRHHHRLPLPVHKHAIRTLVHLRTNQGRQGGWVSELSGGENPGFDLMNGPFVSHTKQPGSDLNSRWRYSFL